MIDTPTTLILGAGASVPFGFPTAGKLIYDIWELVSGKSEDQQLLEEDQRLLKIIADNYNISHLPKSFCRDLHLSQQPSVDDFIERRPEYLDIGKLSIHYVIHHYEKKKFMEDPRDFDWYHELWKILNVTKLDDFRNNKLSIITFNYDRSLEFYLITSIRSSFPNISFDNAKEILFQTIPIIHIYGSLGEIISSNTSCLDSKYLSYGGELKGYGYNDWCKNLKIIPENHQSESLLEARKLISKSERIYFLGFGYGETNLKRLEIGYKNDFSIVGTSYKMPLNAQRAAKKIIGNLTLKNVTCKEFMHEVEFD